MISIDKDLFSDDATLEEIGGVALDSVKPKILIIGHCGHGKDTIAEYLAKEFNIKFSSSSMYCIKEFIADELGYESADECFADRHFYKEHMKQLISEYNTPKKDRLSREILEDNDMYVGMRKQDEYDASKNLFDAVFYVDASNRKGVDDSTLEIEFDEHEMLFIDNNDDVLFAEKEAEIYYKLILNKIMTD